MTNIFIFLNTCTRAKEIAQTPKYRHRVPRDLFMGCEDIYFSLCLQKVKRCISLVLGVSVKKNLNMFLNGEEMIVCVCMYV